MPHKLLAVGMVIPILILVIPNVYASESNSKRYNDGFSNGGQAAATDKQQGNAYNPVCDPTGQYTSDGQHSTTYCTGWANGYSAAWNGNNSPTQNNNNNNNLVQQTCSQFDSNGNCLSNSQPQSSSHTSLGDKVCAAYHNGSAEALFALLAPLHLVSGGTTAAIFAIGGLYCASHGG